MRILIYGCGVVGSNIAYELLKNDPNADLTVLARGERAVDIADGISILHLIDGSRSCSKVKIIDSLSPDDFYDIIFVALRYDQIKAELPFIFNNYSKRVVFFGANPHAYSMSREFSIKSKSNADIFFGFFHIAGRIVGGVVESLGTFSPTFHIGTAKEKDSNAKNSMLELFNSLFVNPNLKWFDNMYGYLKTRIAIIVPILYLTYIGNYSIEKAIDDENLVSNAMGAIREGISAIDALGYAIVPSDVISRVQNDKLLRAYILNVGKTSLGKLTVENYARSPHNEMAILETELQKWILKSQIKTPHFNYLLLKLAINYNPDGGKTLTLY